ncbi:hypothetical protein [Streptomyces chartreusis]|uniref:hypothetical protein n=1 Tax=Streptomyces chartreusis TaxID=1969 RepID=UPI0033B4A79E
MPKRRRASTVMVTTARGLREFLPSAAKGLSENVDRVAGIFGGRRALRILGCAWLPVPS